MCSNTNQLSGRSVIVSRAHLLLFVIFVQSPPLFYKVHRDLKPENILWDTESKKLTVIDLGVYM